MPITIRFDFRIQIIQPSLTKSMAPNIRQRINLTGDFTFTKPKTIQGPILFAEAIQEATIEDITKETKERLNNQFESFNKYADIIDKRCKHINVIYNPNKKSDEGITEACSKVFGSASGQITYNMYVNAIKYAHKLDRYLAHRSIQNQGTI